MEKTKAQEELEEFRKTQSAYYSEEDAKFVEDFSKTDKPPKEDEKRNEQSGS